MKPLGLDQVYLVDCFVFRMSTRPNISTPLRFFSVSHHLYSLAVLTVYSRSLIISHHMLWSHSSSCCAKEQVVLETIKQNKKPKHSNQKLVTTCQQAEDELQWHFHSPSPLYVPPKLTGASRCFSVLCTAGRKQKVPHPQLQSFFSSATSFCLTPQKHLHF